MTTVITNVITHVSNTKGKKAQTIVRYANVFKYVRFEKIDDFDAFKEALGRFVDDLNHKYPKVKKYEVKYYDTFIDVMPEGGSNAFKSDFIVRIKFVDSYMGLVDDYFDSETYDKFVSLMLEGGGL